MEPKSSSKDLTPQNSHLSELGFGLHKDSKWSCIGIMQLLYSHQQCLINFQDLGKVQRRVLSYGRWIYWLLSLIMTDPFIEPTVRDFRLRRQGPRLSQFGFLWHKREILWANKLLLTWQELHTNLLNLSYQVYMTQFSFFASGSVACRKFCQCQL